MLRSSNSGNIAEYAGILLQLKMRVSTKENMQKKQQTLQQGKTTECVNHGSDTTMLYPNMVSEVVKERPKPIKSRADEKVGIARLDLTFLIIFPILFLFFNFVYWFGFLYVFPE